jgi:hypothetical protein
MTTHFELPLFVDARNGAAEKPTGVWAWRLSQFLRSSVRSSAIAAFVMVTPIWFLKRATYWDRAAWRMLNDMTEYGSAVAVVSLLLCILPWVLGTPRNATVQLPLGWALRLNVATIILSLTTPQIY